MKIKLRKVRIQLIKTSEINININKFKHPNKKRSPE